MARRVIRTEYVDDDAPAVRRTEVVEDAPLRRLYTEEDAPYVRRTRPMLGMPVGALIGLAVVAVLVLILLLGRV